MPIPSTEPASDAAKNRVHKKVNKRQKELLTKLKKN
jgi:hypothetical protein